MGEHLLSAGLLRWKMGLMGRHAGLGNGWGTGLVAGVDRPRDGWSVARETPIQFDLNYWFHNLKSFLIIFKINLYFYIFLIVKIIKKITIRIITTRIGTNGFGSILVWF